MESERRNKILLGALLVVLAAVIYRVWAASSEPALQAPGVTGQTPSSPSRTAPVVPAPDVRLASLQAGRPKLGPEQRNLFRFKPKAPPPPSPGAGGQLPGAASGPPGPVPPPPIALKFIGTLDSPGQKVRLAVLSDGRDVFQGGEGQVIEGRYKIVRIGVESLEISYSDGRGRQTIPLSGR